MNMSRPDSIQVFEVFSCSKLCLYWSELEQIGWN